MLRMGRWGGPSTAVVSPSSTTSDPLVLTLSLSLSALSNSLSLPSAESRTVPAPVEGSRMAPAVPVSLMRRPIQ
ncbi:hypothetical protein CI238_06084 [Colletotrichum incanum]|uniref:Uncharacterized protein n=1 Tax=Colletotrichum incanum TaxID=1573173 RepID=A0A161XS14_COLIC|nr:hypothetical protein CI238_06084 [Colletotrichum incanum]